MCSPPSLKIKSHTLLNQKLHRQSAATEVVVCKSWGGWMMLLFYDRWWEYWVSIFCFLQATMELIRHKWLELVLFLNYEENSQDNNVVSCNWFFEHATIYAWCFYCITMSSLLWHWPSSRYPFIKKVWYQPWIIILSMNSKIDWEQTWELWGDQPGQARRGKGEKARRGTASNGYIAAPGLQAQMLSAYSKPTEQ